MNLIVLRALNALKNLFNLINRINLLDLADFTLLVNVIIEFTEAANNPITKMIKSNIFQLSLKYFIMPKPIIFIKNSEM